MTGIEAELEWKHQVIFLYRMSKWLYFTIQTDEVITSNGEMMERR